MLNWQIRRTATLNTRERSSIVALCLAATPTATGFADLFSLLPGDGLHLLGEDAGELATHAVVTTRRAQPTGLPILRTAYVDAVATAPSQQGRGFGSALLGRLAAAIADESYELGCLETGRVAFYERLGWERWRGPLAGRGDAGLIPTPDQEGVMVLRLPRTPPLDLDGLLTIERQAIRIW